MALGKVILMAFDFSKRRSIFLLSVLLFLLTVWVFLPCKENGFNSFDDQAYVYGNSHVNTGLSWQNFLWAFYGQASANWHPLTWLSHQLDTQIYGLNPWGHHLTNVLLHALNTVLVFLVFRKLTGLNWQSLIIALLFGLHPLRVEPVAWISERKDLLSTLFWLLAIWTYAKFSENLKPFYGLTLLFFMLGLLSKQMVVTLPFVFLLLDFWPLQRLNNSSVRRLILEKIPFFALTIAASVIAYIAKHNAGALQEIHLPLGDRIENAFVSYVRYLGKFFWPENLCLYYPHPGHWPMMLILPSILFVIGVSVLAWLKRKQIPYLFVGWFWYLGTLIPVIGLVQLHSLSMADVYTYVPMMGIYVILVLGLNQIPIRWHKELFGVALAAIVGCIVITRHQLTYWKDDVTLWSHAIAVTKDNYVAHANLGTLLTQPDLVLSEFQEAVRIKPDDAVAQRYLANELYNRGRLEESIVHFQKSLELDPASSWTEFGLGMALFKTGKDGYMVHFQKAVELDPNDAGRQYIFGIGLYERQQKAEGLAHLKKAVALDPNNVIYQNALGTMLVDFGQEDEGIVHLLQVIKKQPDNIDSRINLALIFIHKGQWTNAIIHLRKVIQYQPTNAAAQNDLGAALLKNGQLDDAIIAFQKTLQLKPDYADAQRNLRAALKMKGQSTDKP